MALFSSKKSSPQAAKKAVVNTDGRLSNVLTKPWLSEKALIGTEAGVYVFEVPPSVTKTDVAAAIEMIYKVSPRKVRMVNLPAKRKALRTRRGLGLQAARHKAYVYLAKGETIALA